MYKPATRPRRIQRAILLGLFLAASLLLPPILSAQTTGRIVGQTLADDGSALPGVTVTLTSPALQGEKIQVTDLEGRFRFLSLPPGTYSVKSELEGFTVVAQNDVRVGLDTTAELAVTLQAGVREEILVVSEAPVIDRSSTTTGASFGIEMIENLPVTRDYQGIAFQAPGVVAGATGEFGESNPSISGASAAENKYIVDGLDTTDPAFGTSRDKIAFEFVQEVQVKSGGYSAEYGGALGGVLNIVTKSGGNELTGDAFVYYDDDSLQESPPETPRVGQLLGVTEYDYGVGLGGKIVRDHLWFFGALNPRTTTVDQTNQGGTVISNEEESLTYAGKLTWLTSESSQIQASVFGDQTEEDDIPVLGAAGFVTNNSDDSITNLILRGDKAIGGNLLLEGSVGRFDLKDTDFPELDVPRYEDSTRALRFSSASGCADPSTLSNDVIFHVGCVGGTSFQESGDRSRDQARGALSWFQGTGPVEHDIKIGFDWKQLEYHDNSRYPGPSGNGPVVDDEGNVLVNTENGFRGQRFDLFENSYLIWDYRQDSVGKTDEASIYLQDEMRIGDHFTLDLGLRATRSESTGEAASDQRRLEFDFEDQLAPRLGFTYDVARNGKSKLYGHWGRFYESVPLDINVRAFGNENFELWFMLYPEDGSLPQLGNLGTNVGHTAFGTATSVAEGIQPTYTEEAVLGFEYEIASGFSLGLRGIERDIRDVIEDISVDGGSTYFITNPGGTTSVNPVTGAPLDEEVFFPTPRREYRAVELTFQRRRANGWQLAGSYVHASSEGNYGGLYRQDTGQLDPNITSVYDLPELLEGADGPLLNDREHQVKVYGSLDLPFGMTAGFFGQYLTGFALTKYGAHETYGVGERFVEPRGTAGRSDDLWNVDLHLEYPVQLGNDMRLRLIADVFNVSNEQTPTAIDQDWTFAAPSGVGLNPGECGGPGTGQGTTCEEGNPNWGTALAYQKARTIRFGAKLSW